MRRLSFFALALSLITILSACSGSSSTVQRNDHFSGMTLSMPIGTSFK